VQWQLGKKQWLRTAALPQKFSLWTVFLSGNFFSKNTKCGDRNPYFGANVEAQFRTFLPDSD